MKALKIILIALFSVFLLSAQQNSIDLKGVNSLRFVNYDTSLDELVNIDLKDRFTTKNNTADLNSDLENLMTYVLDIDVEQSGSLSNSARHQIMIAIDYDLSIEELKEISIKENISTLKFLPLSFDASIEDLQNQCCMKDYFVFCNPVVETALSYDLGIEDLMVFNFK